MGGTDDPNEQTEPWAGGSGGRHASTPSTAPPDVAPPAPAAPPLWGRAPGPATMGTVYSGYPTGRTPTRARSAMTTAGSVAWALAPLFTFGWAAPATIGWAAHRLRSRVLTVCASVYTVALVAGFVLVGSSSTDGGAQVTAGFCLTMAVACGATIQSFLIRDQVVRGRSSHDVVVESVVEARRQREASRRILDRDPLLARELLIGRPDLDRRFDDGGLVDVNHVPVEVLVTLPGIDRSLAETIVDVRDGIGGFTCVDDLSVTLHLQPQMLDAASARMVFVR